MDIAMDALSPAGKALITGATGYIGSHLVKKMLQIGWQVAVIKRPDSKIDKLQDVIQNLALYDYDGSTASLKMALKWFKPDIVFHLASCSMASHKTKQIEILIQSNILFGTQLLEAMQLSGVNKIVNTSTVWQTSGGYDFQPFSLYASTKQAFEDILQFYANSYGVRSISLRLPDSYGPDDIRPKILNLVMNAAQTGESLKMSGGDQEIDLLYVDDIVDGFIHASELLDDIGNKFRVFSLSSKKPIPLRRIIEEFESVNDIWVKIEWGALSYRENEIMKVDIPNNILPNWKSKMLLEDGLRMVWSSKRK